MNAPRQRGTGSEAARDESGAEPGGVRTSALAEWLLWSTLATLTLSRLAFAFVPSMSAWGLNTLRFLSPLEGWGLWALAAVTLFPPVSRTLEVRLASAGAALAGARLRGWAAMAMAALVWSLPDQTWVTGDFLLRDLARESGSPGEVFRQALPLELLLHRELPRLTPASGTSPNFASRLLGAGLAALLALLAASLTREWGFAGRSRAVAALAMLLGGTLTVFTGLAKPAATLCVLLVALAWGVARLMRGGRGGAIAGLALALALLTHRSALAFVPFWAAALAWLIARGAWRDAATRRELLFAALPPLAALAAIGPRMVTIFRSFDLGVHVVRPADRAGPLAAAFAPLHLLDLANLLALLVPALLPALALVATERRVRPERGQLGLDLALALPFALILLFIHPTQGVFRDLDVFAPAGMAFAILAARVLGAAFERGTVRAWLAPAVVAAVAIPSVQWLLHFHDPERGFARARAFGVEAPARDPSELARLWDALTYRDIRLGDWQGAVEAASRSAALAPHPRAWLMLGMTQTGAGDHASARRTFLDLAERYPGEPLAWVGVLGAAVRTRDAALARRAIDRIRSYPPDGREARLIRQFVQKAPYVWPNEEELRRLESGDTLTTTPPEATSTSPR